MQAVFAQFPEKIIRHSERVRTIAGIVAGRAPKERIPDGLDRGTYCVAIGNGAYYHDIGIYLSGNAIHERPAAAEKLLAQFGAKAMEPAYDTVMLETARRCHSWYLGEAQPDEDMPFHAAVCGIADAVDMFLYGNGSVGKKTTHALQYIRKNSGVLFLPGAVACLEQAEAEIYSVYASWLG